MAADLIHLSWDEIAVEAQRLADRHLLEPITAVYGPPMGGYPVAAMVADHLGVRVVHRDPLGPGMITPPTGLLVVDDLVDSGRTLARFAENGYTVDALYRKGHTPPELAPDATLRDGWLVFPWERQTGPEDAVVRLLEMIGEDPSRDGLHDTPRRVVKAWREMTAGYGVDIGATLGVTFDVTCDEMVVVRDIPFSSLCEHHVLPFTGTATVAYIPGSRVVGLSKLARLVDAFARRLQVQERMTEEIAQAMWDNLDPAGVGVVVRGSHSCMSLRGVQRSGQMVTSSLLGVFRDPAVRAEFLHLAG